MSAWLAYAEEARPRMEAEIKVELDARGLTFLGADSAGPDDPFTVVSFATAAGEEANVAVYWADSGKFEHNFQRNVAHQLDRWLDPATRGQEPKRPSCSVLHFGPIGGT